MQAQAALRVMQKEAQQEYDDPDRFYQDQDEDDDAGGKKRRAPSGGKGKGRGKGRGRGRGRGAAKKAKQDTNKPEACEPQLQETTKAAEARLGSDELANNDVSEKRAGDDLKRKATSLLCSPQRRRAVLKRALANSPAKSSTAEKVEADCPPEQEAAAGADAVNPPEGPSTVSLYSIHMIHMLPWGLACMCAGIWLPHKS